VTAVALSPDLNRRYPALDDLEKRALRRIPRIARDYLQSGVGSEVTLRRNREDLDAVDIVPRFGLDIQSGSIETTLFGKSYSAPIGIAPMGLSNLIWPEADRILASVAQEFRLPYVLSAVGTTSIEDMAKIAPDVFWFQLYGFADNDHAISYDLLNRAKEAGAHVLVVTIDIPVRARRLRDIRNGMTLPFHLTPQILLDAALHPSWALANLRHGRPNFASLVKYADGNDPFAATAIQKNKRGGFVWKDVARFRDLWPGALVVKGILDPRDAEIAISLGVDGIQVSNHGGRQFDAAPSAIAVLPAIRSAVGSHATVLFDSGVQSGLDVVRALTKGANFAFSGRTFLSSVAALETEGARHATRLFAEEIHIALGQMGANSVEDARNHSSVPQKIG
jgi:L-lactate dehydrogenase (cytochrome)